MLMFVVVVVVLVLSPVIAGAWVKFLNAPAAAPVQPRRVLMGEVVARVKVERVVGAAPVVRVESPAESGVVSSVLAGVIAASLPQGMTEVFAPGAGDRDLLGNVALAEALHHPGDPFSGVVISEYLPRGPLVTGALVMLEDSRKSWLDDTYLS